MQAKFIILILASVLCTVNAYSLTANYSGATFFDNWNFFTDNDPTHGYVNYVNQAQAKQLNLISAGAKVTIAADSTNIASGRGRNSVRLTSKRNFNNGLFVMDATNMPTGCGTWPAWWLVGPSWPNNGEIDIIEGVNVDTTDATTLHTSNGCTMDGENSNQFTGKWSTGTNGQPALNCYISAPNQNNNQGCGIIGGAYGASFNSQGGGVYALEWTNTFIRSFFFSRNAIPGDLNNPNPNPNNWGKPYAYFQLGNNCPSGHFRNMTIVINLTFCGDWAGGVFSSQCPGKGACNTYVQNNPKQFSQAFWSINYVKVFT